MIFLEECRAGQYRNADMKDCKQCDENKVSKAGDPSCTACVSGYVANEDQTNCSELMQFESRFTLIEKI